MYGLPNAALQLSRAAAGALAGKRVIVVGGTAGIGAGLARAAAAAGARVTVLGRTQRDASPSLEFVRADLESMAAARRVARALPAEGADVVCFTNGIVPGNARKATSEGVEQDMAVSALSRHVMLKELVPRLRPSARVLVWGFPGSAGYMKKTSVDDFNSERAYSGGFETPHMNTVALNEALVLHWASKGVTTAGFNPGLIKTGIRDSLHGGGVVGQWLESFLSFVMRNPSVEEYADRVLWTFTTPDLAKHSGAMFGQSGSPILPSPEFAEQPELVAKWIAAADALADKALASAGAK